jgi:hypothetical protein
MAFAGATVALPLVREGKLRALAVTGKPDSAMVGRSGAAGDRVSDT